MMNERRRQVYLRQTGRTGHPASTLGLTPAQRRRWAKKRRRELGK